MANLAYTCSISKQDCHALYNTTRSDPGFTASSCVPYQPWYTGDVGICGWTGAPCVIGRTWSNCNVGSTTLCVNGTCTGGLGDDCQQAVGTSGRSCNGQINCGTDGKCGGAFAEVGSYNYYSDDSGPKACPFETHCISGLAYTKNKTCTDPAATSRPSGSSGSLYGNRKTCPSLSSQNDADSDSQNNGAAGVSVGRLTIILLAVFLLPLVL